MSPNFKKQSAIICEQWPTEQNNRTSSYCTKANYWNQHGLWNLNGYISGVGGKKRECLLYGHQWQASESDPCLAHNLWEYSYDPPHDILSLYGLPQMI